MNRTTAAWWRDFANLVLLVVAVGLLPGCPRLDLYDQPRHEPLEASALFADGASARPLVPGTVPRGSLKEDRHFFTGMEGDSAFSAEFPFQVTREVLERGRERYDIFCSVCHDRTGSGRGMIVRRGYQQPTSFHVERLRNEPAGYYFDVITNGFAKMPNYAAQIPPADRWAIAAYVRALQLSQHVLLEDLPAGIRSEVERAVTQAAHESSSEKETEHH